MNNDKLISMDELESGSCAVVSNINIDGKTAQRLRELGLIEGTRITSMFSAFSGDPTAYMIRGAVIALRENDCQNIYVCCE